MLCFGDFGEASLPKPLCDDRGEASFLNSEKDFLAVVGPPRGEEDEGSSPFSLR